MAPFVDLRRSSWTVWFVGVGVYFLAFIHRASLGVAGNQALDRLEISATALGTFVMVQLGMYALMQIPAGVAIDRYGPRRVLLASTLIVGTAQVLFAFATNFPLALLARGLLGIGDAAVFIAVLRLAAGWFPRRRYAVLTMATGLAGMAGNLVATVPLVIALGHWGWTTTFLVAGLTSIAYSLLLLRPAVADRHQRSAGFRTRPTFEWDLVVTTWKTPETRLGFWTHQATLSAGLVLSLVWGFPYLTQGLGYSGQDAAGVLSVYVVANVVASFIVGPLAGRYPTWRTPMAWVIALVCTGSLLGLALWPTPPRAAVLAVFIIVAVGGPTSQIGFHLVRDYNPPDSMSTATGVVNAGGFSGAMLISLAVGIALDASSAGGTSDYRVAIGTIGVAGLVSTTAMTSSLLRVRARVLDQIAAGAPAVVRLTPRPWDRAYRRITGSPQRGW